MPGSLARIGNALLLWWLVVTLTFVLVRAAPGDPAALLIPPSATPADAARLRAELGLDAPIVTQYARWGSGVLRGDLGTSFATGQPVSEVIGDALPLSLGLGVLSLALSVLIGIAIGLVQAARRGRPVDTALTIATTALYAAPTFWLALVLVTVFTWGASRWGFPAAFRLPAFGVRDPASTATGLAALADAARHAILPLVVLGAVGAAGIARYARTSIADVIGAEFVRAARARGLGRWRVHGRHVLRVAMPPLVVLVALTLPGIVAGSVFVETVFAWPGMGRAMLVAIQARDYPVVLGATLLYAALVIAANWAADAILPIVDPRRR